MRALRKSLVVSADMAHGFHPNYPSKHDPDHAPKINGGLVIKHNANQRYATNAVSATLLRELAGKVGEKVQEFAVKSDSGCGSTIGPIIATLSGIATVDVGSPQFSMHSIRYGCVRFYCLVVIASCILCRQSEKLCCKLPLPFFVHVTSTQRNDGSPRCSHWIQNISICLFEPCYCCRYHESRVIVAVFQVLN